MIRPFWMPSGGPLPDPEGRVEHNSKVTEKAEAMKLPERVPVKSNKMGLDDRLRCHRCGGIMAYEKYYGVEEQFFAWRCICCGDIVDRIILENRGAMAVAPLQL